MNFIHLVAAALTVLTNLVSFVLGSERIERHPNQDHGD
jgi:hypothetical protein